VHTLSPQVPAQKPATQPPLVQASSVVQSPPGPTEFAAMQVGKLQTSLAQSEFASQRDPLGSGSTQLKS
jgi:hypothetical protein